MLRDVCLWYHVSNSEFQAIKSRTLFKNEFTFLKINLRIPIVQQVFACKSPAKLFQRGA